MAARTNLVQAVMNNEEFDAIDTFRRRQADLPTRAEAIRRLVAFALKEKATAAGSDTKRTLNR